MEVVRGDTPLRLTLGHGQLGRLVRRGEVAGQRHSLVATGVLVVAVDLKVAVRLHRDFGVIRSLGVRFCLPVPLVIEGRQVLPHCR